MQSCSPKGVYVKNITSHLRSKQPFSVLVDSSTEIMEEKKIKAFVVCGKSYKLHLKSGHQEHNAADLPFNNTGFILV